MAAKKSPKCEGKTRAGKPCRAKPMKNSKFCLSHSDASIRESVGFVASASKGHGRPRVPRATELQKAVVEAAAEKLLTPYLKALGLDVEWRYDEDGRPCPLITESLNNGLVVHGESKDGDIIVSDHEDLKGQIDIVEKMFDRVFGRPKQTQEIAGAGGGPVRIEVPRSAERASEVARILAGAGALPSESPHEGRRRSAASVPAKASKAPPNGNGSH
jgi:hypothetical protein